MKAPAFLLIDAGNTAVKSVLIASQDFADQAFQNILRLPNHQASPQLLCEQWSGLASQLRIDPQVVVLVWACVGPATVRQAIEQAFFAWTKKPTPKPQSAALDYVFSQRNRVLRNAYAQPMQLGADRWVSALGMASRVAETELGAHLIVSAGTATTIDLIKVCLEADNLVIEFSGGWILPGLGMMQTALRTGTAGLGVLPTLEKQEAWTAPRSSSQAIGQGIALAQSGFVDLLAQVFEVNQLWLHGGAAAQWKSCLELTGPGRARAKNIRMVPALAFEGLACIAALG